MSEIVERLEELTSGVDPEQTEITIDIDEAEDLLALIAQLREAAGGD